MPEDLTMPCWTREHSCLFSFEFILPRLAGLRMNHNYASLALCVSTTKISKGVRAELENSLQRCIPLELAEFEVGCNAYAVFRKLLN